MPLTFSEELEQIVSQFKGEDINNLRQFRRMVGPFTVQYERSCRRFNIPVDLEQLALCNEARTFFHGEDDNTEVSICPTTTAEEKQKAIRNSDLCSLKLILHHRTSGLRLRMLLEEYIPEARETELKYQRIEGEPSTTQPAGA